VHQTATGGSAIKAIDVLIEHGVPEERILFLNLVAAPEGLANVFSKHPSVKVVSAWVDEGLDDKKFSQFIAFL
jgi:uracil phosphoribosyltransferase